MNKGDCGMWRAVLFSLSVAAILAGCASANLQPITLRSLDSYPIREEKNGVLVIIEPLFTEEREDEVFSAVNLVSDDIYTLHLIVRNQARNEIFVSARTARFVWSGHKGIPPSNASTVYKHVKSSVAAMGFLFGIAGAVGTAQANEARMTELTARELEEKLLLNGETLSGFLYFVPPEDAEIKDGKVRLTILDTDANEEVNFEIPIPSQYFEKVREKLSPEIPPDTGQPPAESG